MSIADEDDAAAEAVYLEGELAGVAEGFADGGVAVGGGHEEDEAAAAGAEELAADGAGLSGGVVPGVDALVADAEAEGALQLPALVEELAEGVEVAAAGDRVAHGVGEVAHAPQDRHLVARAVALLLEDDVGVALRVRVEHEHLALELLERFE